MPSLWRLWRSRYTRVLYEFLASAGLTATAMIEYRVAIGSVAVDAVRESTPQLSVRWIPPERSGMASRTLEPWRSLEIDPGEWTVEANADGEVVGRALVRAAEEPYVEPLQGTRQVPGAYIRRLFVAPDWRRYGVGSRVLAEAIALSGSELDCEVASAFVAAPNRPSRALFESLGFEAVRSHRYVRLGPGRWESTRPLESGPGN